MNQSPRWRATFAARPAQYTQRDELAWLLCGWSIGYTTLLLLFPGLPPPWQAAIHYAPMVVMLGSSVILLTAMRQGHPAHQPNYRLACGALVLTQLLNLLAILWSVRPFATEGMPGVTSGFVLFVLVYISLICSIGLFVPFWRFPRIPVLRITLDAALVMALSDVLLRLLMPALMPAWQWNEPLLASAFRLETTLGLFFWYTLLFFRFGRATVIPIWLWLLGFGCLLINDAIVLWATFFVQRDQYLVLAAVPFWMLNQTLWALALYRNRETPVLWREASILEPAVSSPRLGPQVVRLVVTLSTLMIVVATGPALPSVLWFFCALLSRELLTLFERARALEVERASRASLAAKHDELVAKNEELQRTEAERAQATDRLRQLSDHQAQQLEQRQLRAAEVAHDIGNLLHPARVTLALMEEALDALDEPGADEVRPYLATMEANVMMSENLLKTIVAAARLDAGVLQLQLSRVAVAPLLTQVVQYQQARDLRPPVDLTLELPATLPPVRADEDLLMRAVLNLVGNAVKYTSAAREDGSGKVHVAAWAAAGLVKIRVCDNGPGIASEVLERLGQPFVRGVEAPHAPAGFGLGLAFSRGVIEQHPRGQLTLTSRVGEGTTVLLVLEAASTEPRRVRTLGAARDEADSPPPSQGL